MNSDRRLKQGMGGRWFSYIEDLNLCTRALRLYHAEPGSGKAWSEMRSFPALCFELKHPLSARCQKRETVSLSHAVQIYNQWFVYIINPLYAIAVYFGYEGTRLSHKAKLKISEAKRRGRATSARSWIALPRSFLGFAEPMRDL